jgi:hypothetical protein
MGIKVPRSPPTGEKPGEIRPSDKEDGCAFGFNGPPVNISKPAPPPPPPPKKT